MPRTRRPHRLVLATAGLAVLVGIGLLISPWDRLVVVLGWTLIIGAVIAAALTLYLVRTPSS